MAASVWKTRVFLFTAGLCLALVSACSTIVDRDALDSSEFANPGCARLYGDLHQVTRAVRDSQYHSVPGLPMVRTSRFLSSFDVDSSAQRTEVLREQNRLAQRTLLIEFANLAGEPRQQWLAARGLTEDRLADQLADCGELLVAEMAANPQLTAPLSLSVSDAYRTSLRVLGLYPLVAPVFRLSVVGEQRDYGELAGKLRTHLAREPGAFRLYYGFSAPLSGPSLMVEQAPGQATLSSEDSARLFARHAPRWLIETRTVDDLPGRPVIDSDGRPAVDTQVPAVYAALTRGRFGDSVTTQLNYVLWFPARPAQQPLDLLAGRLDSLIWRVHLDGAGRPIAYDSIHSCGCWYKIWPAEGYRLTPPKGPYIEPVWAGPALGSPSPLLGVSAIDHQLTVLAEATPITAVPREPLASLSYASLKTLKHGPGTRSLFDRRGFVPGTQRLERWLFWPMGIANPGAMRVLGNQPIAFVGRRHFDDPRLLDDLGLSAEN